MADFLKLKDKIINLAILIIVIMVLIYTLYKIAETLIGKLPAVISTTIIGLVFLFVYAVDKKVRNSVSEWLKS